MPSLQWSSCKDLRLISFKRFAYLYPNLILLILVGHMMSRIYSDFLLYTSGQGFLLNFSSTAAITHHVDFTEAEMLPLCFTDTEDPHFRIQAEKKLKFLLNNHSSTSLTLTVNAFLWRGYRIEGYHFTVYHNNTELYIMCSASSLGHDGRHS